MTDATERSDERRAVGGAEATWTVGEKYGFSTIRDHHLADPSQVWFTLTEGALTEARFPRIDLINLRVLEVLVTDPSTGYARRTYHEQRHRASDLERSTERIDDRALRFRQRIESAGDREWELTVEPVPHDDDAIVLDVDFAASDGHDYDVYVAADLALGGCGHHDVATREGVLSASHDGDSAPEPAVRDEDGEGYEPAASLQAASGFNWATVDVVGGEAHAELIERGLTETTYDAAEGNVVLLGRLATGTDAATAQVALGFATDRDEALAAERAADALEEGVEAAAQRLSESWHSYLDTLEIPESVADDATLLSRCRAAAMVMKAADAKAYPGAGIASPAVPWGDAVAADDPGDYGYGHVWGRDLYQTFTAFEALGDVESAIDAAEYCYEYQQREDGFLPQNTFVDGRTRWPGEQIDEIAFPAVMAHQLSARHGYGLADAVYGYGDVANSADYVATHGPWTEQERWEEEPGYSPSTAAAAIAGLVCAAALAREADERADALAYAAVADYWQARVEEWTVTETGVADPEDGAAGDDPETLPRYVRISRTRDPDEGHLRTHNNGGGTYDEREVVDGGFLELPRLGVTPADDEVIENSLRAYDRSIKVETPPGPAWYRYTGDGYGEKERGAGAPWATDSVGRGRLWPFFTGERGEYELLAGTEDGPMAPESLLDTLAGFANDAGMFPEQVWDREGENRYGWAFGEGTSAATPLSWTSAQFVRLAHSLDAGRPVERPRVVADRYADGSPPAGGPDLEVDVSVEGDHATVHGETDGADLVVKSNVETIQCNPDGAFETTLTVGDGRQLLVLAADDTDDPLAAATTVVEHRHDPPE